MLQQETHDGLAIVRLAHGTASAMDIELCRALADVFADLDGDDHRSVVLTGTGHIFSAGVDLKRLLAGGPAYLDEFLPALDACFDALWRCGKPVVAAVNGHAIAGGCVMAAASDFRLMAAGTGRIGVPELLVGVPFPPAVLEIMRAAVPAARFREIVLLGRSYPVDAAREVGLIDEVVEPDVLLERACAVAGQLGATPAAAFRLNKRQICQPALDWLAGPGSALADACRAVWRSDECRAAIQAYVDRTL